MYQNFRIKKWKSLVVITTVLFLATGCDSAREKMAAAIKPTTVEEVVVSVNEKIDQQKFMPAQVEGEKFLDGKADASGHLAWAIAKASAQTGDHDLAIKYMGQALKTNAVTGPQAMAEPLMEPIRTDIRFVSLVAGIGVTQNPVAQVKNSAPTHETPSPAIRMDAQGIEVKTGDIVIKLPN